MAVISELVMLLEHTSVQLFREFSCDNPADKNSNLFLGENSSTFESVTKIVPRVDPKQCQGGAVLAPLFSQCTTEENIWPHLAY